MENRKKRILNVDGKKNRRELTSTFLSQSGYDVVEAAGAAEALKLAGELPDLILLEAKLRGASGFEICRKVKADPRTALIPVVLITSRPVFSRFRLKNLKEGEADGYLVRPVHPQELLSMVKALLRPTRDLSQVEEKLRESEENYKTLIDGMNDTAWVIGYDGKFIDVNAPACKIFGYSREEFLTMSPHDIDVSLKAEEINSLVTRMPAEKMQLFTTTHCTRDGREIPVEIKSTLITYHGKPAILSIARDITERKKAEQEMKRRLVELEALQKISSALRLAETLEDMLPLFLDETLSLLNTDAGAIWLYNTPSGTLRFAVARNWFSQLGESSIKSDEGIIRNVFLSGEAYLSREFATDPLLKLEEAARIPEGWGGACLPIRNAAETEGVLVVSVQLPREISPEELKLLSSLSDMAGVAINRLSLYEETVRRLNQMQSLHAIDLAINASLDLNLTLDVLLEHVAVQLAVDTAVVFLLQPHLGTLEFAAGRGLSNNKCKEVSLRLGEGSIGKAALERRTVLVLNPAEAPDDVCTQFMRAEGFVANASVPLISKGEVKGVLGIFSRTPFQHGPDWLDFLETLAGQAAIAVDNARLFESLQQANQELLIAYDATIEGWANFLELRDKETEGHSQRVMQMTLDMAKKMDIPKEKLIHVRRGALLHDIGKMGIPDSVLQKQGTLNGEEWEIMRCHPQFAYDMLSSIEYLRPALEIPYCHHENWDGTGYPRGLQGEEIPLEARIFAVVDVYDALTSDRPYRPAWTEENALEYIHRQKGKQFDPQVVELFLKEKSYIPRDR